MDHVTFAEPYDARLREVVLAACEDEGHHPPLRDRRGDGRPPVLHPRRVAMVHRPGLARVSMTQMPEAALAAELGVPFAGIALVTDYGGGLAGAPAPSP